jgi:RecB family exonuclease
MPYKGKYIPNQDDSYRISRSKVEDFMNCPRCFYLDRVLGIAKPSSPPFNLNIAVDHLLKLEFDEYRRQGIPHPMMTENGIDAIPFYHECMDQWRENFVGVQHLHPETNLLVFGAVDDLWVNPAGELIVVDYKATSKDKEVSLDDDWQIAYKRQMEIYQWLLRKNGFAVSDTGYFVYCNGKKDRPAFNGVLEFDIKVIPYTGDSAWVDNTILDIKNCLDGDCIPEYTEECDFCIVQMKLAELASQGESK